MTTVTANDVRIPAAVRDAVARHEAVTVLSHGRPVLVIVNPDDYADRVTPEPAVRGRGRPLRDALAILATAPPPDPGFADDMRTVRESAGPLPDDPWERS
jgi:PHD/YefM family antitoxin component YafN of YafNO toxin-antitoxin module